MKLILFRDGQPGVGTAMPGDNVCRELSDLLGGGELSWTSMYGELCLITAAQSEDKPCRYVLRRTGRADWPIFGDCAVIAVIPYGQSVRSVSIYESIRAKEMVVPIAEGSR